MLKTKKTSTNIVMPVEPVNIKAVERPSFNYNTYLKLSPVFKALIISTTTAGKYNINKNDKQLGFYFWYVEQGVQIAVPLSAIFNTNDKLKGLLGIAFSSAKNCPSHKRGLCQLPDGEICYALQGERQGSKKPFNFLYGMGSSYNAEICIYYWNLFEADELTRLTLIRYLNYYSIDLLRFNIKGDFKNLNDILALNYIANAKKGIVLYGYTARDDLYYPLIELISNNKNIVLNGSNIKYNNRFYCTSDIREYLKAKYPCRGGCLKNNCRNCFKLNNKLITVLIHGNGSDTHLKTPANIELVINAFNDLWSVNVAPAYNLKLKGLLGCLNRYLITTGLFKQLPLNKDLFKYNKQGNLIKVLDIKGLLDILKTWGGF